VTKNKAIVDIKILFVA